MSRPTDEMPPPWGWAEMLFEAVMRLAVLGLVACAALVLVVSVDSFNAQEGVWWKQACALALCVGSVLCGRHLIYFWLRSWTTFYRRTDRRGVVWRREGTVWVCDTYDFPCTERFASSDGGMWRCWTQGDQEHLWCCSPGTGGEQGLIEWAADRCLQGDQEQGGQAHDADPQGGDRS